MDPFVEGFFSKCAEEGLNYEQAMALFKAAQGAPPPQQGGEAPPPPVDPVQQVASDQAAQAKATALPMTGQQGAPA